MILNSKPLWRNQRSSRALPATRSWKRLSEEGQDRCHREDALCARKRWVRHWALQRHLSQQARRRWVRWAPLPKASSLLLRRSVPSCKGVSNQRLIFSRVVTTPARVLSRAIPKRLGRLLLL